MESLTAIGEALKRSSNIVILTGAGVSTASGIPDFRSSKGLWTTDHSREYYMSADYFSIDPVDFWKKYKNIFKLKLLQDYEPNRVHQFIKDLEIRGKDVSVITQNVDGLHAQAGNADIIEYHGTLNTATCPNCGETYDLDYVMAHTVPYCQNKRCQSIIKPDVVLFGDMITAHNEAESRIDEADFLLVLGSSLFVSPFNLLPDYARFNKNITCGLINKEPTMKDRVFDHVVHDDLSEAISHLKPYV
ncbi:NAD-dependent protein deacylase [Thalassobacillus sp. CUG 92003]|uniref:NAD-dependent protein deacylase n=1 Tax=Thalassobacillus sp. CUG 92003 TaxID=2736641 RepID=UPI0015E64884